MNLPKPLRRGSCVGLIGPGSPITHEQRLLCKEKLEAQGFSVVCGEELLKEENIYGYLAGTARGRAEDVNRMFADGGIEAVFCTRGGYGSMQLLPYLDYACIRKNPKVFVGYSDVTALHTALWRYCKLVTFHGPMVKPDLLGENEGGAKPELWRENEGSAGQALWRENGDSAGAGRNLQWEGQDYTWNSLWAACGIGDIHSLRFQNPPGERFAVIRAGRACGRLLGGNLSVLARSLGSAYGPGREACILFLEDVGESLPRIHMYLTQLQYAGVFDRVRGVLLGDFTGCGNQGYDGSLTAEAFLLAWFGKLGVPVVANVCSDHRSPMGTLPLGALCRMEAEGDEAEIYFSTGA